ncbi:MAG TPA: trimethylamine methyltransferase family protein, partial [Thermoplasmata archaeon]
MAPFSVKRGLGELTVLTHEQRKDVHERSLSLLESMGIKVYSDEALDILKKGGAQVDPHTKIAKIPGSLVE